MEDHDPSASAYDDNVYASPEDIAAQAVPFGLTPEQAHQMKKKMRRQLIIGILVGALGVLGTTMGIVGQSFSLRSARAMERVGDQLEILNVRRCEAR